MSSTKTYRARPHARCLKRQRSAWWGQASGLTDVGILDAAGEHAENTGHAVVLEQTSRVVWDGDR